MNIVKGNLICLRKEYIEYYNGRSDLKITNNKVIVKEIIDDKVFPYLVYDQYKEVHNIGWEDIDENSTKSYRFVASFKKPKLFSFIKIK